MPQVAFDGQNTDIMVIVRANVGVVLDRARRWLDMTKPGDDIIVQRYNVMISRLLSEYERTNHVDIIGALALVLSEIEEYETNRDEIPPREPGESEAQYKTRLAFLKLFD